MLLSSPQLPTSHFHLRISHGRTFLVVQWLRLCSQCRGPRFDPWSGNWIPHAAVKISCAATNIWYSQIN